MSYVQYTFNGCSICINPKCGKTAIRPIKLLNSDVAEPEIITLFQNAKRYAHLKPRKHKFNTKFRKNAYANVDITWPDKKQKGKPCYLRWNYQTESVHWSQQKNPVQWWSEIDYIEKEHRRFTLDIKRCINFEVARPVPRGRSKKFWLEVVDGMKDLGWDQKLFKIGMSGEVW